MIGEIPATGVIEFHNFKADHQLRGGHERPQKLKGYEITERPLSGGRA